MRLTSADKKIVKAFLNRDPGEKSSKKLWTDGTRLDGLWMGGSNIAEWKAGKLHFRGFDSRSQQAVARAVVKEAPPKWMARVIHPESEWALPRKKNEGVENNPRLSPMDYTIRERGGFYTVATGEPRTYITLDQYRHETLAEAFDRARRDALARDYRLRRVWLVEGSMKPGARGTRELLGEVGTTVREDAVRLVEQLRGRNEGNGRSTKKRSKNQREYDLRVGGTGVDIANPLEWNESRRLFIFSHGSYGETTVSVWEDHMDSAWDKLTEYAHERGWVGLLEDDELVPSEWGGTEEHSGDPIFDAVLKKSVDLYVKEYGKLDESDERHLASLKRSRNTGPSAPVRKLKNRLMR